jgi:hypothetical protein
MAEVALKAAIRPELENPGNKELEQALPLRSTDARAATVRTNRSTRLGKDPLHHYAFWPGLIV